MRLLAVLILFVTAMTWPMAHAQDEADDIQGLFQRVIEALEVGDTETAYLTSQVLLAHPDFDSLPELVKADAYGVAGYATLYLPDFRIDEAIGYLDESERLGSQSPMTYMTRAFAHLANETPANAANDMMRADRLEAGLLNSLRGRDFLVLIDLLAQSDSEEAQELYPRFVEYLLKRWQPENPFETTEYVRYHAARIAVNDGNLIEAGRLVESLEFSATRLRVQIERDFEPFWIESAQDLQDHIRAGAQHTIDFYGEQASANPGFIEPYALKAKGYAQLGAPVEAMAVLDATRERVFSGELINDVGYQMTWLLNDMSQVSEDLGDFDRALQLMSEAAGLSEFDSPNVSQRANLAFMLAMDGQQEAALEEIEQINLEHTSVYGKALVLTARICAHHFLNQPDEIEDDLSSIEESGMIASGLHQYAFSCLDDRERGAALLIDRLEHPAGRTAALSEVQNYLDVEGEYASPYRSQLGGHERALLARPDVAAALERAGRIISPGVTF